MEKNSIYSYFIFIPAILAFILALYPTLTNQWPLSFDIFWHVHLAEIYATYGLVSIDPWIEPVSQINYPPLFHMALSTIVNLFKIDYFLLTRILQPFIAFSLILSASYIGKKMYGNLVGITSGFLILSSLLFSRLVLTLPENIALIFLMFAIYFIYVTINTKNYRYTLIVGLLLLLIGLTHLGALLSMSIIMVSFLIIGIKKYASVINNNRLATAVVLIIIGLLSVVLLIFKYQNISNITQNGLNTLNMLLITADTRPISFLGYIRNIGVLVLLFGLIGFILALTKRRIKDLILILWLLSMFLLSISYMMGINVISYRILIYMLIPLSILGGCGVTYIYNRLKQGNLLRGKYFNLNNQQKASLFIIIVFLISTVQGIETVTSSNMVVFNLQTDWGMVKIAPPTQSEVEVSNWFKENGNTSKVVLTNNYYLGIFLAATTQQPFDYKDFHLLGYPRDQKATFMEKRIGYILYDKTLKYVSQNETTVHWVESVIYYNDSSLIIPSYAKIIYENENYTIVELNYD